jgi:hypothetical protein
MGQDKEWELIDMRGTLVARYATEMEADKAANALNGELKPSVDACYDYRHVDRKP